MSMRGDFILHLALVLLFAAPPSRAETGIEDADHWRGPCRRAEESLNARDTLDFDLGDATILRRYSFENDCSMAIFEVLSTAKYELDSGDLGSLVLNKIDYYFRASYLTTASDMVTDVFNAASVCGYSDWQMGIAKNVTGLDCGGLVIPAEGSRLYQSFKIESNHLFFGDTSVPGEDGASPSRRPRRLQLNVSYDPY